MRYFPKNIATLHCIFKACLALNPVIKVVYHFYKRHYFIQWGLLRRRSNCFLKIKFYDKIHGMTEIFEKKNLFKTALYLLFFDK